MCCINAVDGTQGAKNCREEPLLSNSPRKKSMFPLICHSLPPPLPLMRGGIVAIDKAVIAARAGIQGRVTGFRARAGMTGERKATVSPNAIALPFGGGLRWGDRRHCFNIGRSSTIAQGGDDRVRPYLSLR